MKHEIYKIMIGAPSDADRYVEATKEQLEKWNATHADREHISLSPIHWSLNSYPKVGRPQQTINDSLLSQSQMLIAIFYGKLGTPTNCAESGTIEEIKEHRNQKKDIQLYFRKQKPKSVSKEDFEKVKKYKESIQQSIRYEEYSSLSDFKERLYHNLELYMNDCLNKKNSDGTDANENNEVDETLQNLITNWAESNIEKLYPEFGSNGNVCVRIDNKEQYTAYWVNPEEKALFVDGLESLVKRDLLRDGYDNGRYWIALTAKGYEYAKELPNRPFFANCNE